MTNARTARNERAAKAAAMQAAAARAESRRRALIITSTIIVVVVVIVAVFVVIQNSRRNSTQEAAGGSGTPTNLLTGANGFGPASTVSFAYGQATAPVTLIAYEDLQCPVCREFESENNAQIEKWVAAGQVRVLYRTIAFLDNSSTTKYSTRSLNAAASVNTLAGPAAFKKFHDLLYANQPAEGSAGLTDDQLITYAVQAGAPKDSVTTDIKGQKYKAWTASVTDAASKAGINATPTLLVNGKQTASPNPSTTADWSPSVVDAAVNAALAAAKK